VVLSLHIRARVLHFRLFRFDENDDVEAGCVFIIGENVKPSL
jgi:hypothetical protein